MSTSERYYRSDKIDRGAIYTPTDLARAMCDWAIDSDSTSILDPSSGDGVFLDTAKEKLLSLQDDLTAKIVGVDIDEDVAKKTGAIHSDFFEWYDSQSKFDVILGNPPYIRSQIFPKESRDMAFKIMEELGCEPKNMMSSWVPFTAICSSMLTENGKMAFVLPEELLTVQYASPLRDWLLEHIGDVTICPTGTNLFPDAQVKPLIVLIERKSGGGVLRRIAWSDFIAKKYSKSVKSPPLGYLKGKWAHLFMEPKDLKVMTSLSKSLKWPEFSNYGHACVGVVSGNKKFFIRSGEEFSNVDPEYLTDIVCNAQDIPGMIFKKSDFKKLEANPKRPSKLLTFESYPTSKPAQNLIEEGESSGVNKGYKCRVRKLWYSVPSIYNCDAFMLRQSNIATRLITAKMPITSNSTVHRVIWNEGVDGDAVVASYMNSFTLLMSEILGRPYGGGVLTIIPGDANSIPVPSEGCLSKTHLKELDKLIRKGKTVEAIEVVDNAILLPLIGEEKLSTLQAVRERVTNRRLGISQTD